MALNPGQRLWHWQVLRIDRLGKRATCRCKCGVVREVAIADLQSGVSQSCTCRPLTDKQVAALKQERQQWLLRDQSKHKV
jgi:hypothetical protein